MVIVYFEIPYAPPIQKGSSDHDKTHLLEIYIRCVDAFINSQTQCNVAGESKGFKECS